MARICIGKLHAFSARGPHSNFHCWSRDAEFSAELWLIARRVLTEAQRTIYCEFLLHDRPWYDVDRKTQLGRGQFFHHVYRTEELLGKAMLESDLFPTEKYFGGLYRAQSLEDQGGATFKLRRLSDQIDLAIAA